MASCKKCKNNFPFFTIWDVKCANPLGNGYLCKECYQPYGLVLEKYTAHLKKAYTDPKAAAWIALCYLLAAQKVNLVRTVTAAIINLTVTKRSWEVCRQKAMDLAKNAMSMLPSNSEGLLFLREVLNRSKEITKSPQREIPIQRHASVWGDSIIDIEYEAVLRSGTSIDELNKLVASLPSHHWLLSSNPDSS